MTPVALYNEIDPYAAQWLRNLIGANLIAPGIVNESSICDLRPVDLLDFTQCHFFAGIGVWSYALRRAGWSDDRPIWTGSCPCQPFSAAGRGAGFDDERHLWPTWQRLIRQFKPATVVGEQVASKDADPWIDLVQADMEALDYAFGAVAFASAGVGAPHIRDRTYWVADSNYEGLEGRGILRERAAELVAGSRGLVVGLANASDERFDGRRAGQAGDERDTTRIESERFRDAGRVADADGRQRDGLTVVRRNECNRTDAGRPQSFGGAAACGEAERLADADGAGLKQGSTPAATARQGHTLDANGGDGWPSPTNGFWRAADWLLCRDGKWRPVSPKSQPLAHGAPARVGRLRAYGNAINAEAATEFMKIVMEFAP